MKYTHFKYLVYGAVVGFLLFAFYLVKIVGASNPVCPQSSNGDMAHYDSGLHQIVGGELLEGKDDVYDMGNGVYLQCFCAPDGNGIQTTWYRDDFGETNGSQWNLGDFQYDYENIEYSCKLPVTAPIETPTYQPTPTLVDIGSSTSTNFEEIRKSEGEVFGPNK